MATQTLTIKDGANSTTGTNVYTVYGSSSNASSDFTIYNLLMAYNKS